MLTAWPRHRGAFLSSAPLAQDPLSEHQGYQNIRPPPIAATHLTTTHSYTHTHTHTHSITHPRTQTHAHTRTHVHAHVRTKNPLFLPPRVHGQRVHPRSQLSFKQPCRLHLHFPSLSLSADSSFPRWVKTPPSSESSLLHKAQLHVLRNQKHISNL